MEGTRWLFTGDMEKESEAAVLASMKNLNDDNLAKIDVLKVAHHGSKTSTTPQWLDFWKPNYAIISVGATNGYGHSSSCGFTNGLQENRVQIFRTGSNGGSADRGTSGKALHKSKAGVVRIKDK
ncbi:ComEC/Rec2 family competence protein [Paenibacillus sp. N3.4]|uniref:ComEC/Rec2 family competence protein n=1 Tax=Paenibacillus sp. N3.4 TaxID=2603222 RepID=UPI0021C47D9F|nr:hypothetical protein [Paenibacillus sp. N3.4]